MLEAEDLDYLSQEQKNLKEISQFLGEEQKISKYLYPKFTELEVKKSPNFQNFKTILFIGQTGTGKTTSINFFFNFFLGVKFEDNFRFLLINEKTVSGTQAVSQTQDVSIYYVKPFNGNPALRIIDTPGLGDTRGLQQDKINIDKITSLFQNQIDTVTTICFVLKASDNRLAESFILIIKAFLKMFGNDIIKIFVCLITHWDGVDVPDAIQTLSFKGDKTATGCQFSSLISEMNEPWYFLINNAPFQSKLKTPFINHIWKQSIDTFNEFFEQNVIDRQDASLKMTQEVLKSRKHLDHIIQTFNTNLQCGLDQLRNIREVYTCIQNMQQEINDSSNFTINQSRRCKKLVRAGKKVTNCKHCQQTCSFRAKCLTTRINNRTKKQIHNKCNKCRCSLSSHVTSDSKYTVIYVTEKVELKDLRQKYYSLSSDKSQKVQILLQKQLEYFKYLADEIYQLQKFMFHIKELKTKAIIQPCYESDEAFLDNLINEIKTSKSMHSLETQKTLSNLKYCLELVKKSPGYQFEEEAQCQFTEFCIQKIQEAYQQKLFSII